MKVLLITFPSYNPGGASGSEDTKFNLSLPILKKFAEQTPLIKSECDIDYMVLPHDTDEEILMETIYRKSPDVLGFSVFVWNLMKSLNIAQKTKCVLPHVNILFGGPEADDAERILSQNPVVDTIINGDGERAFTDFLLNRLTGSPDLRTIQGLSFRNGNELIINSHRNEIDDLDSIPSVFDEDLCFDSPVVYYETARGCRCGCIYCREGAPKKRTYSIERIKRDLKFILSKPLIKTLNFIDTVLDDDLDRLKEILGIIAEYNVHGISCGGYFYFSNADDELFDLLLKANFKFARTGVESNNSDILTVIGRGKNNVSRIDTAIPYKNRISLTPYIITFLPDDTPASFRETLRSCFGRGYFFLDFHCTRLRIYPGTKLYETAANYGYVFDHDPPHFVYSNKTFSYNDFVEVRKLVANIVVLCSIFGENDSKELNKLGFNLFETAENIHLAMPHWEKCLRRMSEDVITEVCFSENAFEILENYVKQTVKNESASAKIITVLGKKRKKRGGI